MSWGMFLLKWRNLVCLPMIAILPVSTLADDTAAAMLRSDGVGVLVNNYPVPAARALFPHDLVQTQANAVARLEATGSSTDVHPETMFTFESDELVLEHGILTVNTSRGLKVRAGCVTVTPVNGDAWTHYEVADVDGKVRVSALKNDVYLDSGSGNLKQARQSSQSSRSIVHEGEQKSRDEKCAGEEKREPQVPGIGAALNSPWAVGIGTGIVGLIACLGLCHNDDPLSPEKP